jgi:prephenate dehydrogenase
LKIEKISIIGLGLIGGSIAKALKASGKDFPISAYDKSKETLKKALKEKVINAELSSVNSVMDSDLIFICLPADESLKVFEKLLPKLSGKNIISDVCGVKYVFEEKRNEIKTEAHYIGGHPMAGKETGGYENSDPLLFKNTIYLISSFAENCSRINNFKKIIELLGAKPKFIHPELHDKVVARISHLPQLLSVALIHSVGDNKEKIDFLDYAAGGFRDLTRISSSPFTSWESILKINREEIIDAIETLYINLHKIEDNLASGDIENIGELFREARIKREKISKDPKGFLNPLHDIYLELEDKPGTLRKVVNLIYNNSVNLKDIELQKFIDKYGGVFKLSFETKQDAKKVKSLLIKAGYKLKN